MGWTTHSACSQTIPNWGSSGGLEKVVLPSNKGECKLLHLAWSNPHNSIDWDQSGDRLAGEQLCRKGHEDSAGHQAERGSAAHPCSKEGQEPPGLHLQRTARRLGEIVLAPYTCEPLLGVLCPALGSPVEEKC